MSTKTAKITTPKSKTAGAEASKVSKSKSILKKAAASDDKTAQTAKLAKKLIATVADAAEASNKKEKKNKKAKEVEDEEEQEEPQEEEEDDVESESEDGLEGENAPGEALTPEQIARKERAREMARLRRKKLRAKKILKEFILKHYRPIVDRHRANTKLIFRNLTFDALFRAALAEVNAINSEFVEGFGIEPITQVGSGVAAVMQNALEDDFTSLLETATGLLMFSRKKKLTPEALSAALAIQRRTNSQRFYE